MDTITQIRKLSASLFQKDFLLTWDKSRAELEYLLAVADQLKQYYDNNISTRVFESGLAVSQFRDNSTRTRFSFASAANLGNRRSPMEKLFGKPRI
jgi:ornithine carbamoyltransferase